MRFLRIKFYAYGKLYIIQFESREMCIKYLKEIIFELFFRFQQAWSSCEKLNDKDTWLKLGQSAIANLNVEFGKCNVILLLYNYDVV